MKEELIKRTKELAKNVLINCRVTGNEFIDYKKQLIRCSSSVGANYRAACRAKSDVDFLNKLKIVEEELDESMYFIELIIELNPNLLPIWENVYKEALELLKIMVKSIGTTREKIKEKKTKNKSNKS